MVEQGEIWSHCAEIFVASHAPVSVQVRYISKARWCECGKKLSGYNYGVKCNACLPINSPAFFDMFHLGVKGREIIL